MKKCLASPKWTFKGLWFEVVRQLTPSSVKDF